MAVTYRSDRDKRWWIAHRRRWSKCDCCPLHATAGNHVLLKGRLPADLLYVGEAPGSQEDLLGDPFVGRAGKLLDKLIADVAAETGRHSLAFANLLACAPWDVDSPSPRKVRSPHDEEVVKCFPRVEDVILRGVRPYGVVLLGQVPKRHLQKWLNKHGVRRVGTKTNAIVSIHVYHPAYLLRKGGASSLDYKRTVLELREFVGRLFPKRARV